MSELSAVPYFPWVRQRTGRVLIFKAYVVDVRGRVVRACPHDHSRRNGHTGQFYAERYAERMARKMNRGMQAGAEAAQPTERGPSEATG